LLFTLSSTPQISTLSLHDALPISGCLEPGTFVTGFKQVDSIEQPFTSTQYGRRDGDMQLVDQSFAKVLLYGVCPASNQDILSIRSEEHTSELQSRENLVCRLLLEK